MIDSVVGDDFILSLLILVSKFLTRFGILTYYFDDFGILAYLAYFNERIFGLIHSFKLDVLGRFIRRLSLLVLSIHFIENVVEFGSLRSQMEHFQTFWTFLLL